MAEKRRFMKFFTFEWIVVEQLYMICQSLLRLGHRADVIKNLYLLCIWVELSTEQVCGILDNFKEIIYCIIQIEFNKYLQNVNNFFTSRRELQLEPVFSLLQYFDETWRTIFRECFGTIPKLRQQRDWVGGVRKLVIFADVQYYFC